MHYDDFDTNTLINNLNKKLGLPVEKDDPSGVSSLFAGLFCDKGSDRLPALKKHGSVWQLDACKTPVAPVELKYYGCPVCKSVYGSKEHAAHCADLEREFQSFIATVSAGDIICMRRKNINNPDLVDMFSYKDEIPPYHFARIESYTYCYNGFRCGEVLTVFVDYNIEPGVTPQNYMDSYPYITADYLKKFSFEKSTLDAWRADVEHKK